MPPSQPIASPVAVEVTRGQSPDNAFVESRHRAACAVVKADGTVLHGWGDIDQLVFPRSAIKPIQALPLVETGAADAFNFSAAEISLACASHNSEDRHINTVTDVLGRIGLSVDALECGPQVSTIPDIAMKKIGEGVTASRLRNNCSGKHAGFLTTAVHMGEDPAGYIGIDHPVQKRLFETVSEMCDVDVTGAPWGNDGCSIPALALPLHSLARGMANMADPSGLGEVRAKASERIVHSVAKEPFMMAGTGRFCTAMNTALKGKGIVKTGAEGVMMVASPALKLGIALKIEDGDKTHGANGVALAAVLRHIGLLDDDAAATIRNYLELPVKDLNGNVVGSVRAGDDWPVSKS